MRSRQYLLNSFRFVRERRRSAPLRAALGLVQWALATSYVKERRIAYRSACLLSGRSRGASRRFTVARTKIKHLADQGRLFGVRKSSW